jgi:hypothetical protein
MTNFNRRTFMSLAGIAAAEPAMSLLGSAETRTSALPEVQTGNGEWTYEVVRGWGSLPSGTSFGGTHGAVAQDNAGNIYVSTQSATGVLVYNRDGRLVRTIANAYPEVHSMVHAEEHGEEFFYATVQKGTPTENWLFVKMKTDRTVVLKITAPPEAGFKVPMSGALPLRFQLQTVPSSSPTVTATRAFSVSTRMAITREALRRKETVKDN